MTLARLPPSANTSLTKSGRFLQFPAAFPHRLQKGVDAGRQVPLAVNAAALGAGTFGINLAYLRRRAEQLVQGVNVAHLRAARVAAPLPLGGR